MKVSQYSAADMENFGDVLYPVILKKFAENNGHQVEKVYSFLGGLSPLGAQYETSPINDLVKNSEYVENLIIGGGDILRLDDDVVAGHYSSSFLPLQLNFARRDYWSGPPKSQRQIFKEKNMPPFRGSFFISCEDFTSIGRVAYFSCGAPFSFVEQPDIVRVRNALNQSSYIYVRDEISANKIRSVHSKAIVTAAPDFLIGIRHFYDADYLRKLAKELISEVNGELGRRYLIFQGSEAIFPHLQFICNALHRFSMESGMQVLLLPLGLCHGDNKTLRHLEVISNYKFRVVNALTVQGMLAMIAFSSLFVGISMHGNIVARSFGVPHVFGPLPGVEKIQGAMQIMNIDPSQHLTEWGELLPAMFRVSKLSSVDLLHSSDEAYSRAKSTTLNMFDALSR